MCGRFTLRTSAEHLAAYFLEASIDVSIPFLKPRFNIAPSQLIAAIRRKEDGPYEYSELQWGLIPSWAKDPKIGFKMINARGETLEEKPSFRSSFKRRRCLIVADGFYEWKTIGKRKHPFYFSAASKKPFCFAGLWERWTSPEKSIESATIVTISANGFLRDLHDRMPVILPLNALSQWLKPYDAKATEMGDELKSLIVPIDDEFLVRHEVSQGVNSSKRDLAEYIDPIEFDLLA